MAYTDIDFPAEYFNTVTYTGNGTSQSITGIEFAPKFTWIKDRTSAGTAHILFDIIRGATYRLNSNTTNSEFSIAQSLTAFNSDGFSVGSYSEANTSSNSFVSWNWRGSDSSAVSNTDGSITSTVSANTTSGFSIVSFTGTGANATVGHGLGVAPKWIIVKSRGVENWRVYSSYLGATKAMRLNGTDAADTDSSYWNGEPTSSVFTVGTNAGTNGSSVNMIAYCFAEVKGYSKFGSYTGNGSADGTFVYTGFSPAFVLMKGTNVNGWLIIDNKRTAYNSDSKFLYPQASDAEDALSGRFDFTSNGFKLRNTWTAFNSSGQEYIYMAFAENPFVTSTGIPTPAR
jgi:hypothetical protein